MSAVPVHLQEPLGSFVAEEVVSSIRHSVVNDLTALAALCYRLKIEHVIQLHDEAAARSAHDLLENIQAYVKRASRRLEVSFVPAAPAAPNAVDATAVLRALVARMPPPAGIEIEGPGGPDEGPEAGALSIRMDGGELELALACLLGNAYEALAAGARGGRIRLRCAEGPNDTLQIDVEHDGPGPGIKDRSRVFEPFFSTKPGRLGLGLNIARRIAGRWGGGVELEPGPSGVVSSLSLPRSPYRSEL
jgi:signal transduction histidine kinase